jgi:hypothetical protein
MDTAPTAETAPKRRGRKRLADGEGKTARVELRVHGATKAAWQSKADAAGLTLQAWIERACERAR